MNKFIHQGRIGSRRTGFTILKLVVSASLISVLLALLLPAVQSVRESARLTQCRANLKEIGIGMHVYADSYRVFPTKADSAYQNVAINAGYKGPIYIGVDIFSCPSDPLVRTEKGEYSYHMNSGTRLRYLPNGTELGDYNGLLSLSKNRALSDIGDGLSNSAAFSERLAGGSLAFGNRSADPSGNRYLWYTRAPIIGYGRENELTSMCRLHRISQDPPILSTNPNLWLSLPGYNHFLKPNEPSCVNGPFGEVASETPLIAPSSLHARAVSVLFCDGHVRLMSNDIDDAIWHAMGTINSGDIISE